MMRTSLATFALAAMAANLGCSDDAGPDAAVGNPERLWLKAVEIVGTIELVAQEPEPY